MGPKVREAEGLPPVQGLAGVDVGRQPRRGCTIAPELTSDELALKKAKALAHELEELRRDLTRYSAAVRRALLEAE